MAYPIMNGTTPELHLLRSVSVDADAARKMFRVRRPDVDKTVLRHRRGFCILVSSRDAAVQVTPMRIDGEPALVEHGDGRVAFSDQILGHLAVPVSGDPRQVSPVYTRAHGLGTQATLPVSQEIADAFRDGTLPVA
jgi:hypothetical protein